jgi:hypothetical protein
VILIGIADVFEVAAAIGACLLVNYTTQDGKTNWVEGFLLIVFYFMIVSFFSCYRDVITHLVLGFDSVVLQWAAIGVRAPAVSVGRRAGTSR